MLKIVLRCYYKDVLLKYIKYVQLINKLNNCSKSIMLPTTFNTITLLRSPHVYKKSKVQYEKAVYSFVYLLPTTDNKTKKLFNFFLNRILNNCPKSIQITVFSDKH